MKAQKRLLKLDNQQDVVWVCLWKGEACKKVPKEVSLAWNWKQI